MPCCLVAALLMIGPRFALFMTWVFTSLVSRAFEGFLLPFVGLIFLPWTTLFYVVVYAPVDGVTGIGWLFVILGFLFDLGSYSSGGREGRRRQRRTAY
ncbi:MAG TPA: hypothetical protein VFF40_10710 [Acidimicrobiia bacterium]|nr:hypothetical protein [Acidimicrobiia bacterium]